MIPNQPDSTGRGISLFLIDGTPDGRAACELFNWTGKAYRIPRHLLKASAQREELYKAGIYFLFGREEGGSEISVAYIGEAEEVYRRLQQHQDKEFWTETLVFISKDENLNKAHVKFLEYCLVEAAKQAKRYKLWNGNTPACPAISELERAVMTEFLNNLMLLTGTLGYKIFEPLSRPSLDVKQYLVKGARGANARAVVTAEGIVVTAGSLAAKVHVPSTHEYVVALRQKLIGEGVLVPEPDAFRFTEDYLFSSPSTAAAVVLGRTANGRVEWKDAEGKSLKQNEEQISPAL